MNSIFWACELIMFLDSDKAVSLFQNGFSFDVVGLFLPILKENTL